VKALERLVDAAGTRERAPLIGCLLEAFGDAARPLRQRLRVGETLGRVARRRGGALARHARPLVSAFLAGARRRACEDDEDAGPAGRQRAVDAALLRASCLSGLADVLRTLPAGTLPRAPDVVALATAAVRLDRSARVRRAAAFLLFKMVEGVEGAGGDVARLGSDGSLREMRAALRLSAEEGGREGDAVVRSHCEAALGEIDRFMRESLVPERKREVRIRIL
jgi:hypothetical protein